MEITKMSVQELSSALKAGQISSRETTEAYLSAIAAKDGDVKAYITVTDDIARKSADAADAARRSGADVSPLAGIPAAYKDNLCTAGVKTTCASKMLADFVPPYTATAVDRLSGAGAVMLGKLNMDEFAMGSSTENSAFQTTRNPVDLSRVPGGSSGGSAAAVAAGECAFALGSDTGGSIRQPAAFCGVVGMKPTYGAVSRYGLVAFASSLDQIGPMTRTVYDNALVLEAIAGRDAKDATSMEISDSRYTRDIERGVRGMKIALPMEFMGAGIDKSVRQCVEKAAHHFEALGATVIDVSMPAMKHALPAYYVMSSAEASSNLARFDGIRYGYRTEDYEDITSLYKNTRSEAFGPEVKRRIMLGTFALSAGYYDAYYKKALKVRTLVKQDYERVLEKCDMILSPVAPTTAYRIGEKTSDPLTMYMGDICTVPVNIAGVPALSLPCGADEDGLPVGMQLIGRMFGEATLYRAGYAFEISGGARA